MNIAAETLSGVTMAMFAGASLFFFKFWRASRDRFFLLFSFAFLLISLERFFVFFIDNAFAGIRNGPSMADWIYSVRLIGFMTILIAIIDKNRLKR